MDVSERLANLIEESDYSYEQLGAMTGIAKSSLQRYASGNTRKIPIDAIEKIAPYLGVSAVALVGWEEDKQQPVPIVFPVIFDDETLEHAEVFQALDPRDRGEIKGFANGLLTAGQRDGKYKALKSQSSSRISEGE